MTDQTCGTQSQEEDDAAYFQRVEELSKELDAQGVIYDPARFAKFSAALDALIAEEQGR